MSEIVLQTENLSKHFGELKAVDRINIHVRRGELVGFLGPNGAGKSTGISMLSTILKPTSGDATIFGKSLRSQAGEIRKLIGIVPQENIFYDYLTARENCVLFAEMHQMSKEKIDERVAFLFKEMQLEEKMNVKAGKLSGGMKRRLNIMMGLVMDPELVFIDEPSAGLDPRAAHITWNFIRRLRDGGKTILLTTHNMHEAEELSDRIYIIHKGKIITEGTPQNLKANTGEGEIFDFKFKEDMNMEEIESELKKINHFIKKVQVLGKKRLVVSAVGGIKRLTEMMAVVPGGLDAVENLNIHGNTLEDIFLMLTGENFKEADLK